MLHFENRAIVVLCIACLATGSFANPILGWTLKQRILNQRSNMPNFYDYHDIETQKRPDIKTLESQQVAYKLDRFISPDLSAFCIGE